MTWRSIYTQPVEFAAVDIITEDFNKTVNQFKGYHCRCCCKNTILRVQLNSKRRSHLLFPEYEFIRLTITVKINYDQQAAANGFHISRISVAGPNLSDSTGKCGIAGKDINIEAV